ncbi:MAG: hypothetical protein KatS3mg009_1784 [Acidimicrobiia bacterium]|nr:MAG: hypothetical protein KatS3mg009_1784 [Acidimicrobiia bacterium]
MAPRPTPALSVAIVLAVALVAPAAPASADPARTAPAGSWVRPVEGRVLRGFEPPSSAYGAGHRGVDLAAPDGTAVRAAADGTVVFAGTIADTLHVSVAHEGGLRTSYSFLATVAVRQGTRVAAGQVVGTSGGGGHGPGAAHFGEHGGGAVHFGLRVGETYVDPMVLFSPVDLAEVVALAPTVAPYGYSVAAERRSLLAGLVGGALAAFDAVTRFVGEAVAPFSPGLGYLFTHLRQAWPGLPIVSWVRLGLAGVRGLAAWYADARTCGRGAPPADGTGGSGNGVVLVGGLDSESGPGGRTFDLPLELLGYEPADASWFSYAPDGGPYRAADTYAPTLTSAARLAQQLRARQRAEPGRPVDLIAHSHGGVVVLAFLKLLYDPDDPTLPPIGNVVTIASPLEGAPLASYLVERLDPARAGHLAVVLAEAVAGGRFPDPHAPAIADLAEESDLMRRLRDAPLPDDVRLTTIGSLWDVVVPADLATTDGATHTVVDTGSPLDAHGGVTAHARTLRVVRAALEGRAPPCRAVAEIFAGEVVPPVIAGIETLAVPYPAPAPVP